jgi:hypothetical protein
VDCGAWLVGGTAKWYIDGGTGDLPKDWDVIVSSPEAFNAACRMLGKDMPIRFYSFGGITFTLDSIYYDLWCSSLETFLVNQQKNQNCAVHLNPYIEVIGLK